MIPKGSESFGMFRKVSETLILCENGYYLDSVFYMLRLSYIDFSTLQS